MEPKGFLSLQRCLKVTERIESPWASKHNRDHKANLKIHLNGKPRGPWAFQVTRRVCMNLTRYR